MKTFLRLWAKPKQETPSARELKDARKQLNRIEDDSSPAEYCSILESGPDPVVRNLARTNRTGRFFASVGKPQPFHREALAPSATFYRGTQKARRLVVVFTGRLRRPMLPVPAFLQCIDASDWNALILRDEARMHYRTGVEGYAEDLNTLARRVRAEFSDCSEILAIGTSMGGFPAIRFFLAGGADRAISISGSFPADASLLLSGQRTPGAFDPICSCLDPGRRPLLFAYGAGNSEDQANAEMAARLVGGICLSIQDVENHAVLERLWGEGRLAPFMDEILEPEQYLRHADAECRISDPSANTR